MDIGLSGDIIMNAAASSLLPESNLPYGIHARETKVRAPRQLDSINCFTALRAPLRHSICVKHAGGIPANVHRMSRETCIIIHRIKRTARFADFHTELRPRAYTRNDAHTCA